MNTVKDLKKEAFLLIEELKTALQNETELSIKKMQLEREIQRLRKISSDQPETPSVEIEEDDDAELIKMKTDLDLLKLKINQTESAVELDARVEGKPTESHVKAIINSNPEVYGLKEKLILETAKLKTKESELKRARQEKREKDRLSYVSSKVTQDSPEMEKLENELFEVANALMVANDEVEIVRFKFKTYDLLFNLETLNEDL